ncbi:MAG TPA: basic amino acid ABC transporter substrate-binding protein [Clostridia bacterium]|nr:basic amino acid ABC transporter substrate-binding protein [Clostridia bacterium]
MRWGRNRLLVLLLVLGLTVALVGCGGGGTATPQGSGGDGAASQGGEKVYIVGTEPTFPPFEYIDENTGEIVGFDIDLIKAIADAAGIKVEVQSLGFDGLIPALQAGNIDIVIAGMTVNEERAQAVDFGPSYWEAYLQIAVTADNDEIKSVEDLKGKTVGVQIGTTGAFKAEELKEQGIVKEVKTYNTVDVIFLELMQGTIDAVINDLPVTEAYMARNPGKIKLTGEPFEGEEYAYAVAKGNAELLEKLNAGLEQVKADGTFDELVLKYFGGE